MLQFSCARKNAVPDLRETYFARDTKPFGGYVAKEILQMGYPDNYVQNVIKPFENNDAVNTDTSSVYFCVIHSK